MEGARTGVPLFLALAHKGVLTCALLGALTSVSPFFPAYASDPSSLSYYSLGRAQGLASDNVDCILQDRKGLLWFGGVGGLSRYDGHSFSSFRPRPDGSSLASSAITALLEDSRGTIWVGSDGGGLARFDVAANRFETYAGMLDSDRIFSLAQDRKGRILAGTGEGYLARWDSGERRFLRLARQGKGEESIGCMLVDSRGRIWAGTDGGGLLLYDEEGAPTGLFRHVSGDPRSIGSDNISCLYEDALGSLWIGLADGGVDLLAGEAFRHARRDRDAAGGGGAVRALAEDPEGKIWVGFEGSGLGSLDPSSLRLSLAEREERSGVSALLRDRRGLMWVGLAKGGTRAYNIQSAIFSRYRFREDGRPLSGLSALVEDADGKILAGTEGEGLVSVDPSTGRVASLSILLDDFRSRKILALLKCRDGSLWIGSEGGGLFCKPREGPLRAFVHRASDLSSISSNVIRCLLEDDDGSIWAGTGGGGLDRMDRKTGVFAHHVADPANPEAMRGRSISCLIKDSSRRLWVGSSDGGLAALEPDRKIFRNYGEKTISASALGDVCVTCVFEDSGGGIWVGTAGNGLVRLDPVTGASSRLGGDESLVGDSVHGIREDGAGILWISSSKGLTSYDRGRGDFFLFGAEDGLVEGEPNPSSILLTRKGELWVGGSGGLCRFDPLASQRYAPAPDVVITGLELLGGAKPLAWAPDGSEIVLGYDNGGLGFRIVVVDYTAPSRNRYAMRLEGRQVQWLPLGGTNSGYIAPLAPGRYMLRAKGSNGNGVWNDYGASLSIVVKPPLWGTLWFRVLVALLLAAAAGALVASRVRGLHRRNALLVKFARHIEDAREEERKLAARDVHDEIGQHLMVLNFHAYWLASHPEAEAAERSPRVKDMQAVILDAMASVKAVATRLRPVALDALEFPEALKWYARSFERLSGVKVGLEIGATRSKLDGEAATALFRILQEMLSNVMRHSGARNVAVRLSEDGGWIALETRDDGRGIDMERAEAADSFGLIGMKERCAALGGEFRLSGGPGEGAIVAVRIPLGERAAPKARGLSSFLRRGKPC